MTQPSRRWPAAPEPRRTQEQIAGAAVADAGGNFQAFDGLPALDSREKFAEGIAYRTYVQIENRVEGMQQAALAGQCCRGRIGAQDEAFGSGHHHGFGGLLQDGARQRFRDDQVLVAFLLRQIRNDRANALDSIERQGAERKLSDDRIAAGFQADFGARALPRGQKGRYGGEILQGNELLKMRPGHALQRDSQQRCERFVGEQNEAVAAQRYRTLGHLLHHDAVGLVGSLQGVNLVAVRTGSHDCVHFAASQSAEGSVGFGQLLLEFADAVVQPLVRRRQHTKRLREAPGRLARERCQKDRR